MPSALSAWAGLGLPAAGMSITFAVWSLAMDLSLCLYLSERLGVVVLRPSHPLLPQQAIPAVRDCFLCLCAAFQKILTEIYHIVSKKALATDDSTTQVGPGTRIVVENTANEAEPKKKSSCCS